MNFFWVQGYSSATLTEGWTILVFYVLFSHHIFFKPRAALALMLPERIWPGWSSGQGWKSRTAEPWAGKLLLSHMPCSDFTPLFLSWWKCGLQQVTNLPSYGISTRKVISCVLIPWKIWYLHVCDRARGLSFFFPVGVEQWNFLFWWKCRGFETAPACS